MASNLKSEPRSARLGAWRLGLCGLAMLGLVGCSAPRVQPWDKQYLARPDMALDPDRLETRYSEHIYFSREGLGVGWSIGGGGCGCN